MKQADIVIVGTGHAGAQAAIALRQMGHEDSIVMIGRESDPPYERPPLSKEYLYGEKPFERILIRPPAFWSDRNIELMPGTSVQTIDATEHRLITSDKQQITYRKLIWAGGGSARTLSCSGASLPGVMSLRSRSDADRIVAALEAGARRIAIVGAGYIGLEVAAALRKLEREVVVIEALDRVLARVAGEELSRFFEDEHRRHGVELKLGAEVEAIEEIDGRAGAILLGSGESITCDLVVVGIGIVPSVAPLIAAGASGSNGVDVDEFCRTTLDDVFAIGDCAAHANPYADMAVIRLESVQNANDMAKVAAKTIMGEAQSYDALPWFWSNQYDLRLQTAGLSLGHDQTVMRGDPASRSFTLAYLKEGRVIAFDCVNQTRDYVQGRKLLEHRPATVDLDALADPSVPIKELY